MVSGIQHLFLPAISDAGLLDRKQPHYRECRRREVDIPADIQLCLADGTALDEGSARIANISASGALLTDVRLGRGRMPIAPSLLRVTMRGEPFDGVAMKCRPVRLAAGGAALGVRLEDIRVSLDGDGRRPSTRARKRTSEARRAGSA
jgi:hypothetical protein